MNDNQTAERPVTFDQRLPMADVRPEVVEQTPGLGQRLNGVLRMLLGTALKWFGPKPDARQTYLQSVARLEQLGAKPERFARGLKGAQPNIYTLIYLSMRHLIRHLGPQQTVELIGKLQKNSYWSSFDVDKAGVDMLVERSTLSDPSYLKGGQYIFCCGHVGPHQLAPLILARHGYDVCIVVAGEFFEPCCQMRDNYRESAARHGWTGQMELANAGDPMVVRQMMRYRKQGWSLFLFVDGNAGVGGVKRRDDKMIAQPFLDGTLMVRKGVDAIARMAKLPVVLLECQRQSTEQRTLVMEPPIDAEALAAHIAEDDGYLTRLCYRYIEALVWRDPSNWDGFLHCFHWIKTDEPSAEQMAGLFDGPLDERKQDIVQYSDGEYRVDIASLMHQKQLEQTEQTTDCETGGDTAAATGR